MSAGGVTTEERPPTPQFSGRGSRPWLRAAFVAGALAFLALLAYGVVSKAPEGTIDDSLARGQAAAAPGFDLSVLEPGDESSEAGQTVAEAAADGRLSLEELRGTPVVLNFWASWCEPCRAEAATLEEGWRATRDQGVVTLGLNTQDLSGDAREFLAEFDTTYPTLRDPESATAREWGTTGLPETYFLSADGRVVGHTIGAVSPEQLEAGVDAAKAGRTIGALEGGDRRSVR